MDPITIDGMDEHAFRHEIEDMLRLGKVDEAMERLRALLEPYACHGGVLPARFLDVTASAVEFSGWNKLAGRLAEHDRKGHPISAIGVVLADARTLGGPGPSNGWLAPFIKTFYFSDDAYPFTGATRDDLLDGYTREGFGWQGDYQATDATLSIKGIDDLYGAVVELEDRLFTSAAPAEEDIRAGSIGACYVAALIHQALRETIRKKGIPRPLCVLAACDGVYPFFDAPVAGRDDECMAGVAAEAETEPEEVWPNELEGAAPAEVTGDEGESEDGEAEAELPREASLLWVAAPKGVKQPVMLLAEEDAREGARFTEMASAQRMVVEDDLALKGLFEGVPAAELSEEELPADPQPWGDRFSDIDWGDEDEQSLREAFPEVVPDLAEDELEQEPSAEEAEERPFEPPARHSLRSQFKLAEGDAGEPGPSRIAVLAGWLGQAIAWLRGRFAR